MRTLLYRETDGRLRQMSARVQGAASIVLQDLTYDYDCVGNIVRIDDLAQPTQWSSNTRISSACVYEYDTLSQLTKASGRETAGNQGDPRYPQGWSSARLTTASGVATPNSSAMTRPAICLSCSMCPAVARVSRAG